MNLRQATQADMPHLLEMGKRFHDLARPQWPWSAAGFERLVASLPFVSITDGGFLAGTKGPFPLSPEWIVAHEILWFAEDGTGMRHAREFRKWAHDAQEIRWSCRFNNGRVSDFYSRFAMPTEIVYSELLPCA